MAKTIAPKHLKGLTRLCPILRGLPIREMNLRYDAGADVLYIKFPNTAPIRDSELSADDCLIEYDARGKVVGFTILGASKR